MSPPRQVAVEEPLDGDLLLPRPPGVIRRFWARHPRVADTLIALSALLLSLPGPALRGPAGSFPPSQAVEWVALAMVLVAGAALLARRRAPLLVTAVCAAPAVLLPPSLVGGGHVLLGYAVYAVAVYRSVRACGIAVGAIAAAIIVHSLVFLLLAGAALGEVVNNAISVAVILLIASLLGINVGNRRRYLAALIDRSRQLAIERDQQARLAAGAERTRIAREMHDIVSHSLTVVVALSEGAIAADSPERARAANRIAADTARSALEEMRAMLGVLREVGADASPLEPLEPLDPAAGVESAQRAGFPVTLEQRGSTTTLPRGIRFALGRVVQESITNAVRHAPAATSVRVTVAVDDDAVHVSVRNDGVSAGAAVHTPGFGLRGLRERVDLVGGHFHAGPDGAGIWRVDAVLPIPAESLEPTEGSA